jgi:hypothetical protein
MISWKVIARVLLAASVTIGAGCARTDWIDRTLVTVDVTGTWSGGTSTGPATATSEMSFELEQQGATVKGFLRLKTSGAVGDLSGPVESTVAGDLFRFRNPRGTVEGELTVNGDEMTGLTSTSLGRYSTSLRRVDPSSRLGSPPR